MTHKTCTRDAILSELALSWYKRAVESDDPIVAMIWMRAIHELGVVVHGE